MRNITKNEMSIEIVIRKNARIPEARNMFVRKFSIMATKKRQLSRP